MAFNTNLAGALVFLAFYFLVGVFALVRKILRLKIFILSHSILPLLLLIAIFGKFVTKSAAVGGGLGVFSGTNFTRIAIEFVKIASFATIPQNVIVGVGLFTILTLGFIKYFSEKNKFTKNFVYLTLSLLFLSYLFFASNKGWKDWHTVYLPPLLFISTILMLLALPRKIGLLILGIIFIFQASIFLQRYKEYLNIKDDPGLLSNQIKAIDWVYENSENQGFKVYNYTDTFYEYPYQYLFWWYGLKKYGYLPEEYSNFPLSHKELYVPGYNYYLEPKRGGDRIKFLIIQSDTNGENNKDWILKFRNFTELVDSTQIGKIKVEKYYAKKDAPNIYCIWWNQCK